jgi:hypothetical protein
VAFLINPARWRVKPGPDVELDFRHPLTEGLVGCWVMNERSGDTIVDHAPAGNHGTIVGDSVTRGLALPGPVLADRRQQTTTGWTWGPWPRATR